MPISGIPGCVSLLLRKLLWDTGEAHLDTDAPLLHDPVEIQFDSHVFVIDFY